mmetsp:Transcript_27532/g.41660  ORF Transcript_27532/g.41660 Transcript_27532/m.41660 type:complete len:154 (+) Transcript_27532:33-494(+)
MCGVDFGLSSVHSSFIPSRFFGSWRHTAPELFCCFEFNRHECVRRICISAFICQLTTINALVNERLGRIIIRATKSKLLHNLNISMEKRPHSSVSKPDRPPTEFELKVYEACKRIPAGSAASYGVLASSLDGRGSARSVGGAMRRNPYAPDVP